MLLARRLPRFHQRLDCLAEIIAAIDRVRDKTPEQVFIAERALIQIQIEWEHFVRGLILDSATGSFSNSAGRVYSTTFSSIRSREAAAHKLVSLFPRSNKEPDWYLTPKAIDAAMKLGVSNLSQIAAELGVTPWPMDDLRHLRNFIAHKSKNAALKVRTSGITIASKRIEALTLSLQYGVSGDKNYMTWVGFSKGVATRMAS